MLLALSGILIMIFLIAESLAASHSKRLQITFTIGAALACLLFLYSFASALMGYPV